MMRLMSRLLASLTLVTAALNPPLLAQNQAPAQPPRFTKTVELMRVELTVLDKQTREPIRGLTASHFVIKVNGQPQDVVMFSEVVIPADERAAARWTREAAKDVATNVPAPTAEQRLIVVVMDDAVTASHMGGRGTDLSHRKVGKAAAHGIIDELGPHDLAAVIFAQSNQHAQDFTADRSALRRAVETYNPQPLDALMANAMSLGVLTRAGRFLASIPERRRAIFYITAGPQLDESGEDALGWSDVVQERIIPLQSEPQAALADSMRSATGTSRAGQVPVYPVSTRGLEAPSTSELVYGLASNLGKHDNIKAIADASGGRAVYNTNAPDRAMAGIFRELSSYYTLAYAADFPMDGKLRRLTVDVKHPGAMVEPDSLTLATPRAAAASAPRSLRAPAESGLLASIAGALPSGELPLRLAVAPFADAKAASRAAVIVTLGILVPAGSKDSLPGGKDESVIDARIFNGEGRKQIARTQVTAHMTPDSTVTSLSEVALLFDLPPGRYNARVGARLAGAGIGGSVFTTFTVPDFEKEVLSLTGVAIGRATTGAIGGRAALLDVVPFAPTAERTFTRTDIVGALVRVHQSARRPPAGVTLLTTITSASGGEVSRSTTRFEAAQFDVTRSVEHRAELALTALSPGDYLLTFTATASGGAVATRDVRFTVQ